MVISLLKSLVEIPTPTGREEALEGFLMERLHQLGLRVELQRIDDRRSNIIACRGHKPDLLLCTHIDTYPYQPHIKPRLIGDRFYGSGACDAKGQVALILEVLRRSKGSCEVAFLVDEEKEGLGSALLSPLSRQAIVFEPTGLQICVKEAGAIELELEVSGKSAHGSHVEKGVNAITEAFKIYEELNEMPFLDWVNLGRIQGGKDPGVVPDRCKMWLDVGFLPDKNLEEVEAGLKDFLTGKGVKFKVSDRSKSFLQRRDFSLCNRLQQAYHEVMGREPTFSVMPSWTDAAHLREKGLEVVVFGPGELAVAHTPEEYLSISELEKGIEIIARVLS